MPRLFVALEIPGPVRERLALVQGGVPGARWVRPENLHLSLRFIGEVDEHAAADLDAQFGRISAGGFDLRIADVGSFGPDRNPTVLWAGAPRCDALQHLRDKVDRAVVAAGLTADDRKFKPHVTLARLKNGHRERVHRWLSDNAFLSTAPFPVDRFVLFRSHLNRNGASYEALAEYPLAPPMAASAGVIGDTRSGATVEGASD